MKKYFKIALLILLGIFLLLQFFRPNKNRNDNPQSNAISKIVKVNDTINGILKKACFDCHSNNTVYPWYAEVMPVGWFISNHVKEGKHHLNFDEFGTYSKEDQLHVLKDCSREVKKGAMPLSSYTVIHKDAKLSELEKQLLLQWISDASSTLSGATNPIVTK